MSDDYTYTRCEVADANGARPQPDTLFTSLDAQLTNVRASS